MCYIEKSRIRLYFIKFCRCATLNLKAKVRLMIKIYQLPELYRKYACDIVPLGIDFIVTAACLGERSEHCLILHLADHDS